LVTDGQGLPLAVHATAGQVHESTQVEEVITAVRVPQAVGRPRTRPRRLAGDKGYSVPRVRDWLRTRGIQPIIPHKDNEKARHDGRVKFDKEAYRQRHVIECCVGWLKECRSVGTRFEKTAVNFLAMVKLAIIERYLRILDSSDRA
jgi:transposase